MTKFLPGDLAVVTGPLRADSTAPDGTSFLKPGEQVRILKGAGPDYVRAFGKESGLKQYIDPASLTPLEDAEIGVGGLIDPDEVHDYIHTGDDE